MSESIDDLSQSSMTEQKNISPSMKCYLKNKANEYPCPECGKITNKSNRNNHNRSQFHRLSVLTKLIEKK